MKVANFIFEASPKLGAGHAIRSSVIADNLSCKGWDCNIITTEATYRFIKNLSRFERIEPKNFYGTPYPSDLLVIDDYELDERLQKYIRPYVKKIVVIDDLANRKHDCDILLDQTYGRTRLDYIKLVPRTCKILTGSNYSLIRKEFIKLRSIAIKKRKQTKKLNKVLISMGGSDLKNFTLHALRELNKFAYKGDIYIALGFNSTHIKSIQNYIKILDNNCKVFVNADMPKLIYEADLAIGSAGSGVWERCFLGIPQVIVKTADNQNEIYKNLMNKNLAITDSFEKWEEIFVFNKIENTLKIIPENTIENIMHHVV